MIAETDNCFAIRSIFEFGRTPEGKRVFEERIVFFRAASLEIAVKLADAESDDYAAGSDFKVHDVTESYHLYEDFGRMEVGNGEELWSCLYEFDGTLEEFYEAKYQRFEYKGAVAH